MDLLPAAGRHLCALTLAAACQTSPPPPSLSLQYAGCAAVAAGGRCLLEGEGAVTLWAETLPPVSVSVDGQPVSVEPSQEGGGVLLSVPVPDGATEIVLVGADGETGRLALGALSEPDQRTALRPLLAAAAEAIDAGEPARAEAVLAEAADLLPGDLQTGWQVALHQGHLAAYAGDHREALNHYRQALRLASRLGEDAAVTAARLAQAEELAQVGRLARRDPPEGASCPGLEVAAWVTAERASLFSETVERPTLPDCPEQPRLSLTRARHALIAGDLDAAEAALSTLPTAHTHRLWHRYLTARLQQQRGELSAALSTLGALLSEVGGASPRHAWQARAAEGEVRAAMGDVPGAIAALRAARQILWQHSLSVPLHQGRDRFLLRGRSTDQLLLTLLLQDGQTGAALEVVRTARLQLLRGLLTDGFEPADRRRWAEAVSAYREARSAPVAGSWSATQEQISVLRILRRRNLELARQTLDAGSPQALPALTLRAPEPGELLLTFTPLGDDLVGFAATTEGVAAARMPPGSAQDAGSLLAPFADQIEAAEQITVLPSGALRKLDLHRLPWADATLLDHRPVRYSLDLPVRPTRAPGQTAVVIGDPRLNLPGARAEVAQVGEALTARGLTVLSRSGTAASRDGVLPLLEGAGLLHFSGHSELDRTLTDSAFLTAEGTRLTVGDLLTLAEPPQVVVLSTCDGAAVPRGSLAGLGLAQALLLAGSETVIAAPRPVEDDTAQALMARLYADGADPVAAYRAAMLAEPEGSYRLLVR